MDYLARKISRAKWESPSYAEADDIRADAITGCLRTTNDTLSFWRCHHDQSDVAEVALALTSGPKVNKIDPIHIVLIHQDFLPTIRVKYEHSPLHADTVVKDLLVRHFDAVNLTMTKIDDLASEIARNVRNDSAFYFFTKTQMRDILRSALAEGRFRLSDLSEGLQAELKKG